MKVYTLCSLSHRWSRYVCFAMLQ